MLCLLSVCELNNGYWLQMYREHCDVGASNNAQLLLTSGLRTEELAVSVPKTIAVITGI